MKLVPVGRVADDAIVARDVRASATDAVPLLRAGAQLQPPYRAALVRAGVRHLFVYDEASVGVDPVAVVPRHTRAQAIRSVSCLLEQAARATEPLWPTAIDSLRDVAERLVLEIARRPEVPPTLDESGAVGDYLAMHSVDVACLGVLIAMQHDRTHGWTDPHRATPSFDLDTPRLVDLAHALLLIDLGAAALPSGLLMHPGPIDTPERQKVIEHANCGLTLLPSAASPLIRSIVGAHHERWDGSGYPAQQQGRNIPWGARLAGLADVYVATTTHRVYRDAAPPHQGWRTVIAGAGTLFDPALVEAFRLVIVPYPPGTEVLLADGRHAVVARADPENPLRPAVCVIDEAGRPQILTGVPVQPVP